MSRLIKNIHTKKEKKSTNISRCSSGSFLFPLKCGASWWGSTEQTFSLNLWKSFVISSFSSSTPRQPLTSTQERKQTANTSCRFSVLLFFFLPPPWALSGAAPRDFTQQKTNMNTAAFFMRRQPRGAQGRELTCPHALRDLSQDSWYTAQHALVHTHVIYAQIKTKLTPALENNPETACKWKAALQDCRMLLAFWLTASACLPS